MTIILECLSHTPLQGYHDPAPEILAEVEALQAAMKKRVQAFDPELVVVFAPDHYNGFFYDVMPQFCIGLDATSIGDYKSMAGPLDVPRDIALAMSEVVLAADIDVALSYRMQVDHGFAQALEVLLGGLDNYPVIPVFINSVAPPMASCRRSRLLGDAIGRFLSGLNKRVLLVGSGGISHEPPVPEIANACAEVAERLIAGRNPTPQARVARQERTISAAKQFTAGDSSLRPLNPEWDRSFLDILARGDWMAIDDMSNDSITEQGGKSAHEIRSWVAAFAALNAHGPYKASLDYYRPIPEWIAGFATMQAQSLRSVESVAA
ncbi:MAG: 3-carboxyethylcatechol 2,3-dioxygenase [Advenella sp.]|nr:3-carboxyethylcatechol 2,3-dioxygenase [Advenella sp.]